MSGMPQQSPYQEPPKTSGLSCVVIGCSVLIIGSLIIICGGGLFFYFKGKDIAANIAGAAAKKMVDESEMSSKDKKEVHAQIDRVVEAFKNDEINEKEAERLVRSIAESPLIVLSIVNSCENVYVQQSGLSAEEKEAAHMTMQRVARGLYEKKIDQDDLTKAMAYITNPSTSEDNSTKYDFKQPEEVSDEDVRSFLAELDQVVEDHSISEEEFSVDIGEEVKRIVDEALQ